MNILKQMLERMEQRLANLERMMHERRDEVLDINGAAVLTGLTKYAIYQKTCSRNGEPPEMPHSKQGKRLYFLRSELVGWMTRNRVKNRDDINGEAEEYLASRGSSEQDYLPDWGTSPGRSARRRSSRRSGG